MRRTPFLMLAASFALACADSTSSPLLEPQGPTLDRVVAPDYPPPPYAIIEGGGVSGEMPFTYFANFFVNKPGNVAWLMFTGGEGVTFSRNARIMSVNGKVIGIGTLTVGGTTYKLNTVSSFTYDGACTQSAQTHVRSCASFSGEGFSSARSTWTGRLAYDNNKRIGKPGDGGGGEVCIIDSSFECGISSVP